MVFSSVAGNSPDNSPRTAISLQRLGPSRRDLDAASAVPHHHLGSTVNCAPCCGERMIGFQVSAWCRRYLWWSSLRFSDSWPLSLSVPPPFCRWGAVANSPTLLPTQAALPTLT
jgi:hypothetical protein